MEKDLSHLLSPKSIAVIGASRAPEKVGAVVLKNIVSSKYPGKVYPVNPKAQNIKEIGEVGEKLEKELFDISTKYKINLLGPNCLGFVSNNVPLNATFGQTQNLYGNLRFISQSGAIAAGLFDWCESMGLGFSQFVTLGNKTVINENDILGYF